MLIISRPSRTQFLAQLANHLQDDLSSPFGYADEAEALRSVFSVAFDDPFFKDLIDRVYDGHYHQGYVGTLAQTMDEPGLRPLLECYADLKRLDDDLRDGRIRHLFTIETMPINDGFVAECRSYFARNDLANLFYEWLSQYFEEGTGRRYMPFELHAGSWLVQYEHDPRLIEFTVTD